MDRRLRESGVKVFTDREFRALARATPASAKFLLIRYTRRGILCRLKRGHYAVRDRIPSPWIIANHLYKPSYISLNSALSYYGLIPETVYSTTSITTRTTREFEVEGMAYSYCTIKRSAFNGYRSIDREGETVLIAEREKALADYLYFVYLKKMSLNDRLTLDAVHKGKLLDALRTFQNPELVRWFKYDLRIPDRRVLP